MSTDSSFSSLRSFAGGDVVEIPLGERDTYFGADLGYFGGSALLYETDLFDEMSSALMRQLPPEEHFAATLAMVEWWGEMDGNIAISAIDPRHPKSGGRWHARLTKGRGVFDKDIPGWRRAANQGAIEWTTPGFPDGETGEMLRRKEGRWERMVQPERAKFDLSSVDHSRYHALVDQIMKEWLTRDSAPIAAMALHKDWSKSNGRYYDLTPFLLDRSHPEFPAFRDAFNKREREYLQEEMKRFVDPEDVLGPVVDLRLYISSPSDALIAHRAAKKLAMNTAQVSRPATRRRI